MESPGGTSIAQWAHDLPESTDEEVEHDEGEEFIEAALIQVQSFSPFD